MGEDVNVCMEIGRVSGTWGLVLESLSGQLTGTVRVWVRLVRRHTGTESESFVGLLGKDRQFGGPVDSSNPVPLSGCPVRTDRTRVRLVRRYTGTGPGFFIGTSDEDRLCGGPAGSLTHRGV